MRRLALKKETLVELTSEELDAVVAGNNITQQGACVSGIVSCVTYRCATYDVCYTLVNC